MTRKTYIGTPHRNSISRAIPRHRCDRRKSEPLRVGLDLFNHSPTGFSWGYGGSGPAQLAWRFLPMLWATMTGQSGYQSFKFKVVRVGRKGNGGRSRPNRSRPSSKSSSRRLSQ